SFPTRRSSDLDITLIQGWKWYTDANAVTVGSDEFDYQTIVTHELGHAIGLEHSANALSVMYHSLATGVAHRSLASDDFGTIEDDDETGAGAPHALMAAGFIRPAAQ